MKILGFCEGTRVDAGAIGLIGVPLIHRAISERGHHDVLAIAGKPMPSAVPANDVSMRGMSSAFDSVAPRVVSFPAYGRWYFSPRLSRETAPWAAECDFVTMHSLFSFPVLVGYRHARRYGKPYGVWPHGVLAPVQRKVNPVRKAFYSALIARRILDSASVLFFSARGEREEARELGLRAPSVVIPHGIDVNEFVHLPQVGTFRARYLAGHQGPMVLYLGRLNVKKGIDVLVRAMAQVIRSVPDVKLVIAGGGHPPSFTEDVRRWIADAGIGTSCVLTGVLDEPSKRAALVDCDVFVQPSIAENFGFSMFEAMACRRPVVCSNSLDYGPEIERREAGLSVDRAPDAFSKAIVALLSDSSRRTAMGDNGWRLARDYSWEACGERVETAIHCILNRQPFPALLQPA